MDYFRFTAGQHCWFWRKVNYTTSAPLGWRLHCTSLELWVIDTWSFNIHIADFSSCLFFPAGGLLLFAVSRENEEAVKVQTGNSFWDQYVPLTAGHPHFILLADCYYLRMSFCGSGPFLSINAAFSQAAIRSLLGPLLSGWAAALHLLITAASRPPQRNHYPSKNVALRALGFRWVSFSSWLDAFLLLLFVWRL